MGWIWEPGFGYATLVSIYISLVTCGYWRSAQKQRYKKAQMALSNPSKFLRKGLPSTQRLNNTFLGTLGTIYIWSSDPNLFYSIPMVWMKITKKTSLKCVFYSHFISRLKEGQHNFASSGSAFKEPWLFKLHKTLFSGYTAFHVAWLDYVATGAKNSIAGCGLPLSAL